MTESEIVYVRHPVRPLLGVSLQLAGVPLLLVAGIPASHASSALWMAFAAAATALTFAVAYGMAYLYGIHVDQAGIRGNVGERYNWDQIERVAPPELFKQLGGVLLQSSTRKSGHIAGAIMKDMNFRHAVLSRVDAKHPLAVALRETGDAAAG